MSETNENKLVPKLRFPEFNTNGEWDYLNGDKLFEPIVNKIHNSDLPILAVTQEQGAIPRNMIDYHVSVTEKSVESYKIVEVGDFIISLRSFQGGIEYSNYKGLCSPAYIILRKKVDLENNFYRHYFKSVPFIRDLNKNLEGIRDGKMISYKQFSEILIPKPKPKEQQKIADCFSSLDEVITAECQKMEVLKKHKKGLMQNLFPQDGETVPKLRFKEFEDCEEWVIKPLSEIAENLDSKRIPITESEREKGDVPYYGASGIIDYVKDYIFNDKLLCISEDGANLVARTYPIAFTITGKSWVNNHAHVLKFESSFTQILVENYLNFKDIEDYLTGMAQPKLNRSKLDIIPIPFPSQQEQQKIAATLSSIGDLINAQSQKVETLKLHKKGLLQGLFPDVNEVNV
ncbi:MAG TPA: restriction endonuclease subunit S [Pyrinomonadaceae bacterium]